MRFPQEVLTILGDGDWSGRELLEQLNKGKRWWQRWSSIGFYGLMARMEDAGLIVSRIEFAALPDGYIHKTWRFRRRRDVRELRPPQGGSGTAPPKGRAG